VETGEGNTLLFLVEPVKRNPDCLLGQTVSGKPKHTNLTYIPVLTITYHKSMLVLSPSV
jgi:hypothetical protein